MINNLKPSIKIIIACFIFLLAVLIALSSKFKNKLDKKIVFFSKFDNIKTLSKIHDILNDKINLFIISQEKSYNLAYFTIIIYILSVFIFFIYIFIDSTMWYLKIINTILILILPYVILRTIIQIRYNAVIKHITDAIDEFQYWFFRTKKIDDAFNETAKNLRGSISIPFKVSYYNLKSEGSVKALEKLKKMFRNKHMNKFCETLKIYIQNGGDPDLLISKLNELNLDIRAEDMFDRKVKDRLLKFKICTFILIICTFIMKKCLIRILPVEIIGNAEALNLSYIIIYLIVYYFFIDILQNI